MRCRVRLKVSGIELGGVSMGSGVNSAWSGKGACGPAYALRWSGLRFAQTSLRAFALASAKALARHRTVRRDCSVSGLAASVSWPRRRTHCAHFVRYVQTTATSQITTRASREATSPALLGASEARSRLPTRAFADAVFVLVEKALSVASRQAAPVGGDVCGDEEHHSAVGHSADRHSLSPRRVPPAATLRGYALLNGQMQICVSHRPRGRSASRRRRPYRGRASSSRAGSSGTAATVCDCPAWAASRSHAARSPR